MPTTGGRIYAARAAAGLSQPQLSQATGVSVRTISRVEADDPRAGQRSIRRLEQHLGLTRADTPTDTPTEPDLSQVSALALVAEISRRLEAAERSKHLPLRGGPPVRVRFKTKDGPGKSTTTESPDAVQGNRERG